MAASIRIGSSETASVLIGGGAPLVLICGPCVIESREHTLSMAEKIRKVAESVGIGLIFKASYDKANRTSLGGYRGPGLSEGLKILAEVKSKFGLPVVTDVHSNEEASEAAEVVDLLQIPAFLCRQTDLLLAAGKSATPVMIKKGQFMHAEDMRYVSEKVQSVGNSDVILCERGNCFGYRELIVDFRSLATMSSFGGPVVFDATHSVQVMGGGGGVSSGNSGSVPLLARAAVAVGIDGVFLECHDNPAKALSDGPNMVALDSLEALVRQLSSLDSVVRNEKMKGDG